MSLQDIKDKLEIGLKPDAPYRPANQPESEQPHPPHPAGTDPDPTRTPPVPPAESTGDRPDDPT